MLSLITIVPEVACISVASTSQIPMQPVLRDCPTNINNLACDQKDNLRIAELPDWTINKTASQLLFCLKRNVLTEYMNYLQKAFFIW